MSHADRVASLRSSSLDPSRRSGGSLHADPVAAGLAGAAHRVRTALYSFGQGALGLLGHGDDQSRSVPTKIKSIEDVSVRSIAAGGCHMAALTVEGEVHTWGWGEDGQLGLG